MFGNRKRFLRIGNRIINMNQVCMLEYKKREKQIHFYFTGENGFVISQAEQAGFEWIASALKYGKVKE